MSSFLLTLVLLIAAVFVIVLLVIATVTALWKTMHEILVKVFSGIFRTVWGLVALGLIVWLILALPKSKDVQEGIDHLNHAKQNTVSR